MGYASYDFSIRDDRESERRTRAFDTTEFLGTTLVFPFGIRAQWGTSESTGPATIAGDSGWPYPTYPSDANVTVITDSLGELFASFQDAYSVLSPSPCISRTDYSELFIRPAVPSLSLASTREIAPGLYEHTWPNLEVQWRLSSPGTDPWTTVNSRLVNEFSEFELIDLVTATIDYYTRDSDGVEFKQSECLRSALGISLVSDNPAELPSASDVIQIRVLHRGPVSEDFPYHFEGTAGDFLTCLYSGAFSKRDENGDTVQIVRFDPDAVALMTDTIALRLTEPIDDVRAWTEENIYKPLGWAPTLNAQGCIAPKRQRLLPGQIVTSVVSDANAAPVPSWVHDDTVLNTVRVKYPRFYGPFVSDAGGPARVVWDPFTDDFANDGIRDAGDQTVTSQNPSSVEELGEQVWETESPALAAFANAETLNPILLPQSERGFLVAKERGETMFPRYHNGVPVLTLPVVRADVAALVVGDYVNVDISWMPDYITRERGLSGIAQVISIRDLNCAWRELMMELTGPAPPAADVVAQSGFGFGGSAELEESS